MIDSVEVIGRNPRTVERLLGKPDKMDVVEMGKPLAWRKGSYCKGQETMEKKLVDEGKVVVGEPDKLPSAPTVREPKTQ